MNDPFEDELRRNYRTLDDAAQRLEERLRPKTRRMPAAAPRRSIGPWIAAGFVSAAAAALLFVVTVRRDPPQTEPQSVRRDPPPVVPPVPVVPEERPPVKPPEPENPPPVKPPPEEKPVQPPAERPEPPPPVKPPEPPPKETVPPTQPAEVAKIVVDEIQGAWSLNGKAMRPAKKVALKSGDAITSEAVTKIVMAENRFLLLAAKSAIVVEPEEKRLTVRLDKGEVLAELTAPGLPLRVSTSACAFETAGTVFDVRLEAGRAHLVVEEGVVDAGGKAVRAGRSVIVTEGKPVPEPAEADFKRLAWARAFRPKERVVYEETFDQAGDWQADVAKGVAAGVGSRSSIDIKRKDPPLFRVPVKGRIVIVIKVERAAELAVQIHQAEPKMNFRLDQRIGSGSGWQTIVIELDKIPPNTDPKTTGAVDPGAAIDHLLLMYGREGEKLGIWVDSIRVIETRP